MLEAARLGEIKRLIINIPPGTMKSLLCSVFFHAWWWSSEPGLKVLTASYNPDNTIRDNLKVKSIVKSEEYQSEYWRGRGVSISSTQDGKERFDTTLGGYRIASSVRGTFTGEHPNLIILDDLMKAQDAASPVKTEESTDFLSTTLSTRLALDPIIIQVAQRLNDRDPSAYLMAKGGWEQVVFPMRYETERIDENDPRTIPDPRDHRTTPGELLWPEVWDEEKVQKEENLLGPLASGQLQQYPIPVGGALFKREYFPIVDAAPVDAEKVRGWDVAETDEEEALRRKKKTLGDETWGVRVSRASDGILYVEDSVWQKVCLTDKLIKQVAEVDGRKVKIREGSGSGKAVIKARSILLQGWDYAPSPEIESKTARANNFLSQCRAGNVRMVRGDWNEPYLNRVCAFPFGRYDDPVDATSNAANELMGEEKKPKRRATWGRKKR